MKPRMEAKSQEPRAKSRFLLTSVIALACWLMFSGMQCVPIQASASVVSVNVNINVNANGSLLSKSKPAAQPKEKQWYEL